MTLDQRRAALHRRIDELDEERLRDVEAMLDGMSEPSPDQVMGYTVDGKPFTYAALDERGRRAREAMKRGELLTLEDLDASIRAWQK